MLLLYLCSVAVIFTYLVRSFVDYIIIYIISPLHQILCRSFARKYNGYLKTDINHATFVLSRSCNLEYGKLSNYFKFSRSEALGVVKRHTDGVTLVFSY